MTSSNSNHRIYLDVMNLLKNNYEVTTKNPRSLTVKFPGPKDSLYADGVWDVRVELPEAYPFHSPSVGFATEIFHPNIDQNSGSICLDVLNQKWTALYDLLTVFETFLPQLLRHPNPHDPLNSEAAMLCIQMPDLYRSIVMQHVAKFAQETPASGSSTVKLEEYDSDSSELSDS